MHTTMLVKALAMLCVPLLVTAAVFAVHLLRLHRRYRRATACAAELQRRVGTLEAARADLELTSVTDPLTGVWNYRHLQSSLEREVARCCLGGRPLAVLLLDIDGFEAINAAHGHPHGHIALRDLAQRLALEIRRSDTLGRYGGEEFLVLLPDTGAEGAVQVAERLCWSVRRHRLPLPEHPDGRFTPDHGPAALPSDAGQVPLNGGQEACGASGGAPWLTASIGVALLPGDGSHAATLLRAVGRALGEAKRAGGDCWRGVPAITRTAERGSRSRVLSAHGDKPRIAE